MSAEGNYISVWGVQFRCRLFHGLSWVPMCNYNIVHKIRSLELAVSTQEDCKLELLLTLYVVLKDV